MNKKENISIEKICELLENAPTDDGTFFSALYDLYVFINISKSIDNINNGKTSTLEKFEKEMEELYADNNRRFG